MSSRRVTFGALLVIVALVGYLATHAAIDNGRAPAQAHPRERASVARSGAGVGARAHSRQGAAAAAANYLELLDEASVAPATDQAVRAATLPPLRAQALSAEAGGAALERRLSAGGPAFIRGWRLGWRATRYTPRSASIEVWTMGVVESRRVVVAADYSTTACSLRWTAAGWEVVGAHTTAGPTPPPDGSDPAAVAAFASSAVRFRPFADAP